MTTSESPSIVGQVTLASSPWVKVIEREVCYAAILPLQKFIALQQAPYVSILAITEDRKIPLIRQYRPAVNEFTWELPAGTLDEGESAEQAAKRELAEEAGLVPGLMHDLGANWADTGRLTNLIHCFVAEGCTPVAGHVAEAGLEICRVTPRVLMEWIKTGKFKSQLQIALLGLLLLQPDILRRLDLL